MKVAFIGIGSIAERHINNLYHLFKDRGEALQIDAIRSRAGAHLPENIAAKIHQIYDASQDLTSEYDAIFVTNPTSKHYQTLLRFNDYAKAFFIEKPVFETWDKDLSKLSAKRENVYYVACPLRYTSVIQYIKNNVDFKEIYAIRAISSSYLPEWRPSIDYRNTYSAHKELGGGVAIDLIHEWDYIIYLLGFPKTVHCLRKQLSALEIDSDDMALYIADYGSMTAELHLDYFGRVPIRQLQLFGKNDTIQCDLINGTIQVERGTQVINFNEQRNDYHVKELSGFLDIMSGKRQNYNTIEHACKVLKLAQGEKL